MTAGRVQVQPGCCADCTILSDSFTREDSSSLGADWTEDAGAWEISSNRLRTTSSSARCITTANNPDNYRGKVTASFRRDNLVAGDEVKLFVSYLDSSNTFYAVFTAATAGGVGGTAKMYDAGGTQVGATVDIPSFAATVSGSSTFSLCFNGTALVVNTADGDAAGEPGVAGYGDLAGVGTGTIAGTVDVDDFTYYKHQTDGDSCPSCSVPCPYCSAAVPTQWKIEWDSIFSSDGDCTDCDEFDSGVMYVNVYDECYWRQFFPDTVATNCHDATIDPVFCILPGGVGEAPAGYIEVFWRVYLYTSGGDYILRAEFYMACEKTGDPDAWIIFEYNFGTTMPDCNAQTTPLTMTWISTNYETSGGGFTQICNWASGGNVTITAVPS